MSQSDHRHGMKCFEYLNGLSERNTLVSYPSHPLFSSHECTEPHLFCSTLFIEHHISSFHTIYLTNIQQYIYIHSRSADTLILESGNALKQQKIESNKRQCWSFSTHSPLLTPSCQQNGAIQCAQVNSIAKNHSTCLPTFSICLQLLLFTIFVDSCSYHFNLADNDDASVVYSNRN